MDPQFRYRISWWHLRAKKEKDPWIRFVIYYFIFDAYLSYGSQSGNDAKKLKWFLTHKNPLKSSFDGCWKTRLLPQARALKALSPVFDMRPGSSKKAELKDENNYEEIFNFIYQIRCNLFHGSKDRMSSRDSSLVFHAGEFLRDAINWWIVST